jgi:hypothetical protein
MNLLFIALCAAFLFIAGCTETPAPLLPSDQDFIPDSAIGSVRNESHECIDLEIQYAQLRDTTRSCLTTSDCSIAFVGVCPFGCYAGVNSVVVGQELIQTAHQFEQQSCATCAYTCVSADSISVDCVRGQCVISDPNDV